MIFLSAGLKYHDNMVNTAKTAGAIICKCTSPAAICEITAPVMVKNNPAYAHSLSNLNPGINMAITPNIFQMPMSEIK